jgi:hypothetical protein
VATVKLRQNATIYSVAVFIGKSFDKAFVEHNFEKGFKVTGIYPLNENICVEDKFLSSLSLSNLGVRQHNQPVYL